MSTDGIAMLRQSRLRLPSLRVFHEATNTLVEVNGVTSMQAAAHE